MAKHKKHGLLVYVDVSPFEQITLKGDSKICMVGAIVDKDEGILKLKQYKLGTWKKKMEHAKRIISAIENDEISIHAIGFVSFEKTLMPWVVDIFNEANTELKGKWVENGTKSYNWKGYNYSYALMFGICAHVAILSIIGLRVSYWLKKMKINKATFLLDRFPQNPEKALLMSEALTKLSKTKTNWKENSRIANGANFAFANLGNYTDALGKTKDGKNHPHFVIVDWLAVSMRANFMPNSFKDGNGDQRDANDIKIIASIWNKLKDKNTAVERDLDDANLRLKANEALDKKNRNKSED